MAEFKELMSKIVEKLPAIQEASELFDKELVDRLEELVLEDISSIVEDLKKGNFLGSRKIDIDIGLNKVGVATSSDPLSLWLDTSNTVYYEKAIVTFSDGEEIEISFSNDDAQSISVSTSAEIVAQLLKNSAFTTKMQNTKLVTEVGGSVGVLVRISDITGLSSNVERVQLFAVSGAFVEQNPIYYWAKTTSALQVLGNRTGDVIKLANNIDGLITLSISSTELNELQAELPALLELRANLQAALDAYENAQTASNGAVVATEKAEIATQRATEATNQAQIATTQANLATQKSNEIKAITVQAQTLTAGNQATASYNSADGKFTFGIPKGDKGDRGEAFKVNAMGTLAQRDAFDTQPKDFSYFALDTSMIYFKNSDTSGDWSGGVPFGKGDKGDRGDTGNGIASIARVSGDGTQGTTDTYRISYTDGNTFDFNVYNGADSAVLSVAGRTGEIVLTKSDVGLGNVDNTSDANKPVSIAMQNALSLKANIADIVNNLTSGGTAVPLSAEQGKVLKGLIDNINTDDFKKPDSEVLFVKTSPSSFYIKAGLKLNASDSQVQLVSNYSLSLDTNLDAGSKTAGTDYYIYAASDGSFYISADKTITTDRLIGGFHYGLVGEAESATGNKTEADMVHIRGINAYSFWDLKFRPTCNPEGMVEVNGRWYDIYLLNSEHITNGTSKAGLLIGAGTAEYGRGIPKIPIEYGGDGSTNYGKFTWFQANEIAKSHGKQMISYNEFPTVAYGVDEGKSSSTNGYESVAGKIEHYPNLTSKYGIEQATGTQYIWGSDLANGYGTTTFVWANNTDSRGQIYATSNSPTAVVLGGYRTGGACSGSRCSDWRNYVWASSWYVGCRLACDHMKLA